MSLFDKSVALAETLFGEEFRYDGSGSNSRNVVFYDKRTHGHFSMPVRLVEKLWTEHVYPSIMIRRVMDRTAPSINYTNVNSVQKRSYEDTRNTVAEALVETYGQKVSP